MANQSIGLTHIFPNAEFSTTDSSGNLTGLGAVSQECLVIPISDLGFLASSGSGFSINYQDATGSSTTYTGNADLFLQKVISLYYAKYKLIKDAYEADIKKATPLGADPHPSAVTSNGFGSFSTSSNTGDKLRNSISFTFLYNEPTTTLVVDGEVV